MDSVPARLVDLPHRVHGLLALDEEGYPNIYLNARLTAEQHRLAYDHELRHLEHDDPHNDAPIEAAEARAAGKEALPSFAEQWEAIYRRGKELYGIERDAWVWNYLFDLWFNRDSKLRYTTIPTHVFKEYGKVKLGTMLKRIFHDYFISIGREP